MNLKKRKLRRIHQKRAQADAKLTDQRKQSMVAYRQLGKAIERRQQLKS